jgi:hypothetical protein
VSCKLTYLGLSSHWRWHVLFLEADCSWNCSLLIAVMAYLVGGCMYQRTVMHQRGWRQLPNYSMWAGIWSFFSVSLDEASAEVRRMRF